MQKYKCVNGHVFDGDDITTIKCPQCGTKDFNPLGGGSSLGDGFIAKIIEVLKKYKYIFIAVVVIILLIAIFGGGPEDSNTYDVRPYTDDGPNNGYIVVPIKEYDGNTSKSIPFDINTYKKFNFTLNGVPVSWDHHDTIYICTQDIYELKWTHPSSHPWNEINGSGGGCSKKKTDSKHKGKESFDFSNLKNFNPICKKDSIGKFNPDKQIGLSITGNQYLLIGQSTTLKATTTIKGVSLNYEWYEGPVGKSDIVSRDSVISINPQESIGYSVKVTYNDKNQLIADSASVRVYVSDGTEEPVENIIADPQNPIIHPQVMWATFLGEGKFQLKYGQSISAEEYELKVIVSMGDNTFVKTKRYPEACANVEEFPYSNEERAFLDQLTKVNDEIEYYFKFTLYYEDSIILDSKIKGPYGISCRTMGDCKIIDPYK